MDESTTFTMIDEDGTEVECTVLLTFEKEDTGKNYMVYTDNSIDDDGNISIYAAIFDPDMEDTELYPIETDEEWEMIEKILDDLQREINEDEE